MAKRDQLRRLRSGTIINATSKQQEMEVIQALDSVVVALCKKYRQINLVHDKKLFLTEIVNRLEEHYPKVGFSCHFEASHIKPDGGVLSILGRDGERYPILIAEVKNQGTNDLRAKEGKPKQSKGNAIERLGKNVIGLRAAMRHESIFPFVCFGYGCDFTPDSSILDRVSTIAIFGELCKTYLHDEGPHDLFDRGSYYFREKKWAKNEMTDIMADIAERSVLYYFSKYREKTFNF